MLNDNNFPVAQIVTDIGFKKANVHEDGQKKIPVYQYLSSGPIPRSP